ncbi:MAG: hypothetical protein PHC53_04930 [Patescibacteria group bacterium]|nr:hypothetical protein [Patescibacteria group bacterium]
MRLNLVLCLIFVALCGCSSTLTQATKERLINISTPAVIEPVSDQAKPHQRVPEIIPEISECLAKGSDELVIRVFETPRLDLETKKFERTALILEPRVLGDESEDAYYRSGVALVRKQRIGRIFGHVQVANPNDNTLEYMQEVSDKVLDLQKDEDQPTPLTFNRKAGSTTWESNLVAFSLERKGPKMRTTLQLVSSKYYDKYTKVLGENYDSLYGFGTHYLVESDMLTGFGRFLDRVFAPKYQGTVSFQPTIVEVFDKSGDPICYHVQYNPT